MIELSIVIVSWNVRDLLGACLKSIEAARDALDLEVIVVDSGSVDGSPDIVKSRFPWVKVIVNESNIGFPRGNNIGLKRATGQHILLLNPDTEVFEDALQKMNDYLDSNLSVGVVGPQLLNSDGTVQPSRRRFPSLAIGAVESTWLQPFVPDTYLDRYYFRDVDDGVETDVDWLTGACLMVRREVVEQVGLMDEAYFMYSEELDWCRRIKNDGWRIVYLPKARVMHHVGKSSEQAVTERHINFQRAKLRYFRKYHGRTAAALLRLILMINYSWQLAIEATKGLLGHKRSLRRQRIQEYWQVIRSGLRPAGY
jgi:GT2 family glycosyltransferase